MDDKADRPSTQEVASNSHSHEEMVPKKRGIIDKLYPPGPKPGARGRVKNHCRKFWWCDLLVFAIIALIIVLPIIYVAIPKKAQSDLNASTLEVTEQDVTSPSPDGIHLKLVTVARSDSSFHPTIEGFQAALSLNDQAPFFYIDVPETKAEAVTDIIVDQDVEIANNESFNEYNRVVMNSEYFNVYLDGKTKIHQSGLPAISVDYNKKVTMKGLNKLQGLNITGIRILQGEDNILPDGSNMIGNVSIPNPSVMTLALGNVTMDLSVDDEPIGTCLLPDMILRPGENIVPMQGHVEQITVISLITSKYNDAVLPLSIVGNSSMINGQHLQYYEAAIQSNVIHVDLDVGPALAELGLNLTQITG